MGYVAAVMHDGRCVEMLKAHERTSVCPARFRLCMDNQYELQM